MADSDRLHQLHQQRAKIAEHLAWLDREIAAASEGPPTTAPSRPNLKLRETTPSVAPVQLESNNPSPGVFADPDAVLEQWVETNDTSKSGMSKTGCLIAFGAALLVGILALLAFVNVFYDSAPET